MTMRENYTELSDLAVIPVRHESAPPLAAESAAGKTRPSIFRTLLIE